MKEKSDGDNNLYNMGPSSSACYLNAESSIRVQSNVTQAEPIDI